MNNRIWVYTACYNEEYFVKHFLAGYKDAERIIVYDNMSTDNTVELLMEDPRVEVRPFDTQGQLRNDLLLDIKNDAWKEARGLADWVIMADFDEIFNRCQLIRHKAVFDLDLNSIRDRGFNIIKPFGYNMISMNAPMGKSGHPYSYVNRAIYHVPEEKMLCFRPDKIFEIRYYCGAHICAPIDMNQSIDGIRVYISPECKSLHFKLWNFEYYMERIKVMRERQSKFNRGMGTGWHYDMDDQYHKDMFLRSYDLSKPLFRVKRPK